MWINKDKYKTSLEKAIEKKEEGKGFPSQALKISSEFFSAILVGAALGVFSDKYITHSPWGLIIFLILGSCAGFINVMRYASKSKINDKNSK